MHLPILHFISSSRSQTHIYQQVSCTVLFSFKCSQTCSDGSCGVFQLLSGTKPCSSRETFLVLNWHRHIPVVSFLYFDTGGAMVPQDCISCHFISQSLNDASIQLCLYHLHLHIHFCFCVWGLCNISDIDVFGNGPWSRQYNSTTTSVVLV